MLREVTTYFLLAYGIILAVWLPVLVGRKVSPVFLSLGMAGPTLAALVAFSEPPTPRRNRRFSDSLFGPVYGNVSRRNQAELYQPTATLGRKAPKAVVISRSSIGSAVCKRFVCNPLEMVSGLPK